MSATAPYFTAWLDDFFASYFRHRPVNATFIGVHEHDHCLPDFSEAGVERCLAEMDGLLARLHTMPTEALSVSEQIDRTLAEGFLLIQRWEYTSNHFQRGNPALYTGEAIFSIIALFLTSFAPIQERVAAATARMRAIPALLAQAQANLRTAPRAWTERAIHECEGARLLFGAGIDQLIVDEQIDDLDFRRAADDAALAFETYRSFLSDELLHHPNTEYACGAQAFDILLRHGHFLELDSAAIVAYAESALNAADTYLTEHAADFGATNAAEALAQLANLHPTADAYDTQYMAVWHACREQAGHQQLLTWPDFPIDYVPRPQWVRQSAPYLYFLFYRSPAAVNRPPVHHYLIAPLEPTLTPAEQDAFLRSNNDSVIKLNHVVHHGSIGHHVQNWHAFRSACRIGRMAAVDCAARIAMFCGGTMAEGWACYATDLMDEAGFLTPLESYAEVQSRRRMSARAIVDVKLHCGEFTLDEAAAFYQQRAGMSAAAAENEAVKNSMFPGAALIYLLGSDMIKNLRTELAERMGAAFNLAEFHDRFLSYGSIPVALICAEMRRRVADGRE